MAVPAYEFKPAKLFSTEAPVPSLPPQPGLFWNPDPDSNPILPTTTPMTHPSTPSAAAAPSGVTGNAELLLGLLRQIGMPSPVKGPTSRTVLHLENTKLRSILKAANIQLQQDQAQRMLLELENKKLRELSFAKKNRGKHKYITGGVRLLTPEETLREEIKQEWALVFTQLGRLLNHVEKWMSENSREHTGFLSIPPPHNFDWSAEQAHSEWLNAALARKLWCPRS
ncbi:unnamed protein product [Mycena citricolor]|uniref:Uncharacterized protein n=1 Tax=Mycena citricolor TaxID=2018698 RepID=A0AAD2HL21_9AGAR|nr:unnamed protein product [Mycena citricolor]